jgi:hypothetical protein
MIKGEMKMGYISHVVAYSLILTILLVGVAGAVIPDSVIGSTSKEWLVANGDDSATLFFKVQNNSIGPGPGIGPVPGLRVDFSLNNTDFGILNATPLMTDLDGVVSPKLYTKTKSGTVLVYANISYKIDDSNLSEPLKYLNYTFPQKIDHDTPYKISYDNFPDGVVNVGTELPVTIRLQDYWGNLVDSKNQRENVTFSVQGSPGDLAVFKNGVSSLSSLNVSDNTKGDFNTTLKVSTLPGYHSILVKPLDMPVSEHPYYVRTIANGTPFRIISQVELTDGSTGSASGIPYPYIAADGFSRFFITYTVFDQYGNPVSDRVLKFNTTIPGEEKYLPATTDLGQVKILYGPKDQVGTVTLYVESVDNSSAKTNNTVQFINSTAVDMLLTANPDTMPSRDVPSSSNISIVKTKVVDEHGNGVPDQTVTFSIGPASYLETYTTTSNPSFSNLSEITTITAVSDSNGYATVTFIPGGFTLLKTDSHYDDTATGRCTITSTWNGTSQNLALTWKNYPYLSAEALVSPNVVNVTDNITITLRLKGDGWALQPKPVDFVIVTDLAGGAGGPELWSSTIPADRAFVQSAGEKTSIGLVSFGSTRSPLASTNATNLYTLQESTSPRTNLFNPYGSVWDWCLVRPSQWDTPTSPITIINTPLDPRAAHYPWSTAHYNYFNSYSDATIDANLTSYANKSSLISVINSYRAKGGTNYAAGINAAIKVFERDPHPDHVRAIILMGDGIPMMAPIAPGSTESYWPSDWYPRSTLGWYDESDIAIEAAVDSADRAKAQGIQIYAAGFKLGGQVDNATLLRLVSAPDYYYYTPDRSKLDQVLLTIQGRVQDTAGVNTTASLDYETVNVNQVPVPGVFDYVYKNPVSTMNRTYLKDNPSSSIKGPYYYDQTADWAADENLTFDAGTIKVNQVWETTYMLQVLKPGNIDVFGIGSQVSFNGGTSTLLLPKTLITALPGMNITGAENVTKTLIINNLNVTQTDNIANLTVDVQINPEELNLNVIADIYVTDEDQHKTTWIKSVNLTPVVNGKMNIALIDISQFQLGKQYTFYVDFINKRPGTNPIYWQRLTSGFVKAVKPTGVYIRLE